MALRSSMDFAYAMPSDPGYGSRPHPCLHDPVLFVTNLPAFVSDETLASALVGYGPFRPKILRDGMQATVAGAIEFRYLEKGMFPCVFLCFCVYSSLVLQRRKHSLSSRHVPSPTPTLLSPLFSLLFRPRIPQCPSLPRQHTQDLSSIFLPVTQIPSSMISLGLSVHWPRCAHTPSLVQTLASSSFGTRTMLVRLKRPCIAPT